MDKSLKDASAAQRARTEALLVRALAERGWKRLSPEQIDEVALQLRTAAESSLRGSDGPGETVDRLMTTLEHGILGPISRQHALEILAIVATLAIDLSTDQ